MNGKSSSLEFINAGVPQGSIFGLLLFIIFIDCITQDLSNSSTSYADDVALIAFIKSKEERGAVADSLNQDPTKMTGYFLECSLWSSKMYDCYYIQLQRCKGHPY